MLSDAEMAEMKDQREANMPETVFVQKKVTVSDSAGGSAFVWQTVATVIGRIGQINSKSPSEVEIAKRLMPAAVYSIVVPANAVVDEEMRLQIGSRQFEVVGIFRKTVFSAIRLLGAEVR